MAVIVDSSTCNACGTCVETCPSEALVLEPAGLQVLEDQCIDCGQCVTECPSESLSMPD